MITVNHESQFDVTTKVMKKDIYLRLYLSAFNSGLVSELKPTNFTVLLTICSYMNEKGECYPTQRQIAERSGISKTTVNKAINDLIEYKINGKSVLERMVCMEGSKKYSVYTVNPISQVAIFGGEVDMDVSTNNSTVISTNNDVNTNTDIDTKIDTLFGNARKVSEYYVSVYKEVYQVQPSMNYGKELGAVKNKWIGKFSDEQIKKMIDVGVKEYDARWKNGKFPRPTLFALVSWIGEQALGIAEDGEKEYKEVIEITSKGDEMNDVALSRLQNRLQK